MQKLFIVLALTLALVQNQQKFIAPDDLAVPMLTARNWNGYSVHNCGDQSTLFQDLQGFLWCGNVNPMRCYQSTTTEILVCGDCSGYCKSSVKTTLMCGKRIDICSSCWGVYRDIFC